jgi:hypothetical protein
VLERLAGRVVTGPLGFLASGVIDLAILAVYLVRVRRTEQRTKANRSRAPWRSLCWLLLAAGLGLLSGGLASTARADTTEQSILMDDDAFIYSGPQQVEQNLEQVASLGVNVVKVSMVWSLVAPDPNSTTEPHFDAANPSAYPADAWDRYDTLVEDAQALGLKVYFQLTAPAPDWATNPHGVSGHEHNWSHEPDATEFAQFVDAVGERYSGDYPAPTVASSSSTASGGFTTIGGPLGSGTNGSGATNLPAVHMWGIWNEPNEIGWMSPQLQVVDGKLEPRSPSMYRGLVDAGYKALIGTGHGSDTILIGETASGGKVTTIPFLRDLYCVGSDDQPLSGHAAALVGCPSSGDGRQFVIHNPGLFAATGWAHHPYSFNQAPDAPFKNSPTTIVLANLGVLERNLDRIDSAYGEPGDLPIYVTEWGYKSNPPNPFVKTNLLEQETWLDEGWYLSYLNPRIVTMAQEELYDQPPIAGKLPGTAAYWANFDSGLEFEDGNPKPAYAAFRLPIWIPVPKTGADVRVWAELRPAAVDSSPLAVLEYSAPGSSHWMGLTDVQTTSAEGFIDTRVDIPHAGRVRLAWADAATDDVYYSRTVTIR